MAPKQPLVVCSIGGGKQSTVMALLADQGIITPMPDIGLYADTGWDPPHVMENIQWLQGEIKNFPLEIVRAKTSLRDDILSGRSARGWRFLDIPIYGPRGITRRQCTSEYKIMPIHRRIRQLLNRKMLRGPGWVVTYIGFSCDEIFRVSPSKSEWEEKRFPLIDLGYDRDLCDAWIETNYPGKKVYKSACAGCPYRNAEDWKELKEMHPEMWQETVAIDTALREPYQPIYYASTHKLDGPSFLHKRQLPLEEALKADADYLAKKASGSQVYRDTFVEECEGYCDV